MMGVRKPDAHFPLSAPAGGRPYKKYGRLVFGQTPDCYYMEVVRTFFR